MEVGPLSRLIVSYASGRTDVQELVKDTLGKLNVPVGALFSARWAALPPAGWMPHSP